MDISKLYETCTVYRRTTAVTAGEESFIETAVYSGIPCHVRHKTSNTAPSIDSEQYNTQSVYITIDKGQTVLVGDIFVVSTVRYRAVDVKAFGLILNANTRVKCNLI